MPRPITVPEIPEHIEGILKLVPDFEMTPERWRFREPTIFVEAHNQASFGKRRSSSGRACTASTCAATA